jgi:NAD(P)H dehydrogenase (quinone)
MILITGATGQLGKATIDFLLKKGIPANTLSALVRDAAKANDLKTKGVTLKMGEYGNYASLVAAFQRIDKLLLISSSEVANRTQQHEHVVRAAKEAGVRHILYTSFERKNETETSPIGLVAKSHIETENILKASGIPCTIFRNTIYTDMLPVFLGNNVFETGVFLPAGDGKVAFATRRDMAEILANVLAAPGHENKTYYLSNTERVTLQNVADVLSKIAQKPVPYINPSAQVYKEALANAGVPQEYIGVFAGFSEAMRQGEFDTTQSDMEKLLGRKPATLEQYLQQAYAKQPSHA